MWASRPVGWQEAQGRCVLLGGCVPAGLRGSQGVSGVAVKVRHGCESASSDGARGRVAGPRGLPAPKHGRMTH